MHDSSFGRLIGVLLSPGKTFESIARRPTWVVPMVVLVIVTTAVTLLLFQKADFMEMMRQQMEAQGQQIPADRAEGMEGFMKGCTIVSIVVFPVVLWLVGAAFFLLFNLFGGQLRYPVSLSVLLHSFMPGVVSALLSIPVILSRESFTMKELQSGGRVLKSNLAFLAPEDAGPRLVALLSSLDLFAIWTMVLMVLGYHVAARVSKATAASVVLALWVLLVAIQVLFAGFQPGAVR